MALCPSVRLSVRHNAYQSVCSAGHTGAPCKNGWADREVVCGKTRVGPCRPNHVLGGVWLPHGTRSTFRGYAWARPNLLAVDILKLIR